MRSSLFPDVNVWVALAHDRHAHHVPAKAWLKGIEETVFFCRFTQLGFLRLLTNEQVMGRDVLTQRQAWRQYHRWFEDERIEFHGEPETPALEELFEQLSSKARPAPKLWADAYLAAFARSSGLTLVTFDRALQSMPGLSLMLLPGI